MKVVKKSELVKRNRVRTAHILSLIAELTLRISICLRSSAS